MIPDWSTPENIRTLQTERTDHLGHRFDMQASELIKPEMTEFISKNKLPHLPKLMQQVHKNTVVELQTIPTSQLFTEADACFSKKAGIICTVLTADCLPILITNKQGSIIAAIHCGWRSLYAGIIKNTLDRLKQKPHDLLVWLGPHIRQQTYEVGQDMVDRFCQLNPSFKTFFKPSQQTGKYMADIAGIAMHQLQQFSIKNIQQSQLCTYKNNDRFYSWRKESTLKRQATMIWIEKQ